MKIKIANILNWLHPGVLLGSVLRPLLFLICIKDLSNDIKSEIQLFADDVKLLVRPLSKETTRMDQNYLLYWEYIWKLRLIIEKY